MPFESSGIVTARGLSQYYFTIKIVHEDLRKQTIIGVKVYWPSGQSGGLTRSRRDPGWIHLLHYDRSVNISVKMKMTISCLSGPENHVRS
jgi:hypothetical protein